MNCLASRISSSSLAIFAIFATVLGRGGTVFSFRSEGRGSCKVNISVRWQQCTGSGLLVRALVSRVAVMALHPFETSMGLPGPQGREYSTVFRVLTPRVPLRGEAEQARYILAVAYVFESFLDLFDYGPILAFL
ncbi:hypothetical protein VTO73DRAFT_7273 [Trametes versicolor]